MPPALPGSRGTKVKTTLWGEVQAVSKTRGQLGGPAGQGRLATMSGTPRKYRSIQAQLSARTKSSGTSPRWALCGDQDIGVNPTRSGPLPI